MYGWCRVCSLSIEATWIHPYCGLLVDFEGAVASMDVAVRLEMSMDTDEERIAWIG